MTQNQPFPLTPTEILTQLHTLKPQLVQAYGVHKIDIFGSVARNPAHPDSNIDIVVESTPLPPDPWPHPGQIVPKKIHLSHGQQTSSRPVLP